ncbi:MAG TPA: polysaccharide deacetylase family protein [bacterium]|nr:polysaccharide deacetylase family protein [bacterium]HPN67206.1 polysaccharide deacetylase family protein [bacterium]
MPRLKILFKITLPIFIILFVCGYAWLFLIKSRTFQFFGTLVDHVDTDQKIVALTFDDAPGKYTDEILDILASKNIPATFYAVGQSMEQHPDQTRRIVAAGHELGNHSYSHQRLIFRSPTFIKNEIEQTNQQIRAAGFTGEITFRPPHGKKLFFLPWYLYRNNIKTIMWDIEPDTYFAGDATEITAYTLNNTKPGSIILMHPFCQTTCAADRAVLPGIIDGLKKKGYRFVTVGELVRG